MSKAGEIRSVLIPLQQGQLLLPNALVAEVVGFQPPEPLADAPDWLLGQVEWRQQRVPLVSFERVMGLPAEAAGGGRRARLAICYALGGNPRLPYIALLAHSIPRLVKVSEENVAAATELQELGPEVLRQVEINGEPALIPDMDYVEAQVNEALAAG
jgi:chemosensory pili system protein ChpC